MFCADCATDQRRVAPHCSVVNLVRSGRKQPQRSLQVPGERLATPKRAILSYQVLARKWRPKTFSELVGQEHVVTALTNALTRGRLHHAYLLTGTRGVGKTTIARLLAKSLNCLTHGVTATPCGTCAACTDIDAGRFVDLLELDAASNTGIDNMREILDNARYAPTVGRFKVYLIDEVHMLSKAAFNSMLKTLEEPPEHVKFVLATTDPQKIPVTVLSRCLQFNLKQLPPALIDERLASILAAETIASDPPALALIARAAHGSMRDALSLLDQAIAYGNGEVREAVVRTMLGAVDTEYVYRIVEALGARNGPALLAEVDAMAARSIAFAPALEELASLFHRIAIAQTVPPATATMDDGARVDGARAAARAGIRPARLPDLRAGPRRPPARTRRGDRLFDDAPPVARVRTGRPLGEPRRPGARERRERYGRGGAPPCVAAHGLRRAESVRRHLPERMSPRMPRRGRRRRRGVCRLPMGRAQRRRSRAPCLTIPRRGRRSSRSSGWRRWPRNSPRRPSSNRSRAM